ncbi:hypothetical protein BHE74_00000730 [Ensete ventricosum]|nr:hypothetical protein BHE74_00000730 [Ensete ventricosum]
MEADSGGGGGCEGSVLAPEAVNRTTGDEVWRDIRQWRRRKESREQQPALGEMTLEDFLGNNAVVGAEDPGIAFMPREQHRHCDHHHHHHQRLQHSALASDNPATSDPQTPGRKRAAGGEVSEKTAERRQKRMIKNRESAARSRARKQAYTNELENKISLLQEENERLKKQMELESAIHVPRPETKSYQLRRTRSVPF